MFDVWKCRSFVSEIVNLRRTMRKKSVPPAEHLDAITAIPVPPTAASRNQRTRGFFKKHVGGILFALDRAGFDVLERLRNFVDDATNPAADRKEVLLAILPYMYPKQGVTLSDAGGAPLGVPMAATLNITNLSDSELLAAREITRKALTARMVETTAAQIDEPQKGKIEPMAE